MLLTDEFERKDVRVKADFLLKKFIMLSQMRKTMSEDGLVDLSLDIAENGLLQDILILKLKKREHAREYLRLLAKATGEKRDLRNITHHRVDGAYWIVIAGHRRTTSIKLLHGVGREKLSNDSLERLCDVSLGMIQDLNVTIYEPRIKKPDFRRILALQISENMSEQVPAMEEADAIAAFYRLYCEGDDTPSYTSIGEQIGRSAETVANAVKYFSVPDYIRDQVLSGQLSYSAAIELSRLIRHEFSDEVVKQFAREVTVLGSSAPVLKKKILSYIEHKSQDSLFKDEIDPVFLLRQGYSRTVTDRSYRSAYGLAQWLSGSTKALVDCDSEMGRQVYSKPKMLSVMRLLANQGVQVLKLLEDDGSQEASDLLAVYSDVQQKLPIAVQA